MNRSKSSQLFSFLDVLYDINGVLHDFDIYAHTIISESVNST